jgi:tRNA threonylcarbamoyladenosine biosynthesis protein TsaB
MNQQKTTILGIETSSIVCSVGVADETGKVVERNIVDPHIHSEKLLTLINDVLEVSGKDIKDVDAVAVSMGPGSFTGLRIGLSSAKGLCFSLERPLVPIPTFDAIGCLAGEDPSRPERIHILVDAKQGEFYYGTLDRAESGQEKPMDVRIVRVETMDWTSLSGQSAVWISDRLDVLRGAGIAPGQSRFLPEFSRGDIVARLGFDKFKRGEFADLSEVEPLYLKEFVVKIATT